MRFRIHRMKPSAQEAFRWSAHTGGQAIVKEKDYEPGSEVDAANEYAAWKLLQDQGEPLRPGDLLQPLIEGGQEPPVLKIVKYIGFESAIWWIPLVKHQIVNQPSDNSSPETERIVQIV